MAAASITPGCLADYPTRLIRLRRAAIGDCGRLWSRRPSYDLVGRGPIGILPPVMKTIEIDRAVLHALENRRARVVVSTGAGVSAESGVPTFRDANGLWKNVRPEELATPEAFARDPRRVWEWYEYRRGVVRTVLPNPGHCELVRWERHFSEFTLITQNVDGLHRLAGSVQPIELHGNIMTSRCHECGQQSGEIGFDGTGELPRCQCGGLIRPNVVWFGEQLPAGALEKSWEAVQSAEVFLSVGTSGVVQPAASLARLAKSSGAFLIEVNPEDTEVSYMFDAVLRYPSGIVLPAVGRRLGIAE